MGKYVTIWKKPGFDLIGMDVCYMLGFYSENVPLLNMPAPNQAGIVINPGDVLTSLGGHKTSAAYTNVQFDDDGGLCYQGVYPNAVGDFVCFDEVRKSEIRRMEYQQYKRLYFAYQLMYAAAPRWFFTSRAVSGRILETTVMEKAKGIWFCMECRRPINLGYSWQGLCVVCAEKYLSDEVEWISRR